MKNIDEIRADFPILGRTIYDKPLVYFDNGATTQKPRCVIEAVSEVYNTYNANIHRGVHFLSDMSSEAYENAREKVRSFINADKKEEIVFTSGTTGSINGISFSFVERFVKP
ncbi:MAG TPA: aminotransferase class V-fold PLP-dependent enzyme, partial [Bacteroidales bacterium]|nr:aminotransferase class V-fold PLP-dependent enzyme [Bacteroidales bacterium]